MTLDNLRNYCDVWIILCKLQKILTSNLIYKLTFYSRKELWIFCGCERPSSTWMINGVMTPWQCVSWSNIQGTICGMINDPSFPNHTVCCNLGPKKCLFCPHKENILKCSNWSNITSSLSIKHVLEPQNYQKIYCITFEQ